MKLEKLKTVEERINNLLEEYDIAMLQLDFKKTIYLVSQIETELDRLEKNEIQINSNQLLH